MTYGTAQSGLGEYRKVQAGGGLSDASPHRVVQVMLQTVLDRCSEAKGQMNRGETAAKAESISKALRIIEGLQLNLDREKGGDIAENLDALYNYSTQTLMRANSEDNPELLDEVSGLMNEIKSAWDEIAEAE
ncbi:MAG: flagellar export chaperone FliS [Gammaproteobacteria bacterium]